MASQQPVYITINIIQPDASEVAKLMEMLTGITGTGPAATHAVKAAKAPRAVAAEPEADSDRALRDFYKKWSKETGEDMQLDGASVPMRGRLPKVWRETLIQLRAEVNGDGQDESAMLDVDVIEEEQPAQQPEVQDKRQRFRGRRPAKA